MKVISIQLAVKCGYNTKIEIKCVKEDKSSQIKNKSYINAEIPSVA